MKKIYVQVDSERTEGGEAVPRAVLWRDGRVWEIGSVTHTCVSPDGEYEGVRYTVLIGSAERYLYRAGRAWYVMA